MKGFGFPSFSGFGQPPPEEPEFQLSEDMVLKDLPEKPKGEFGNVWVKVKEAKEQMLGEVRKATDDESLRYVEQEVLSILNAKLASIAHLIDRGSEEVEIFKRRLEANQADWENRVHARRGLSPFLVRYDEQVQRKAKEFCQDLSALDRHLSQNGDLNYEDGLLNLLNQEYKAVLAAANRVANLRRKLDQLRSDLSSKMKFGAVQFERAAEIPENSYAQKIKDMYKQFKADMKSRIKKNNEEADLFGNVRRENAPAASQSSFGTGGSSFGTGFGFGQNKNPQNKPPTINTNASKSGSGPTAPASGGKSPFS